MYRQKTPVVSGRSGRPSPRGSATSSMTSEQKQLAVDASVLQLKQHLIRHDLELGETQMDGLLKHGLVDEDKYNQLKAMDKVKRKETFVGEMLSSEGDMLQKFCDAFSRDPVLACVVDELELERKVGHGDLIPEVSIEDESAALIHKQFGTSKRLSENEKKVIRRIMGERVKVLSGMCEKAIDRAKYLAGGQAAAGRSLDAVAEELSEKLEEFTQENRSRVHMIDTGVTGVSLSTTHMLREQTNPDQSDSVKDVETKVTTFLQLTTRALLEREALLQERKRALEAMGVEEDPTRRPELDYEIELSLLQAKQRLENCMEDAIAADATIEQLQRELERWNKRATTKASDQHEHVAKRRTEMHETLNEMVGAGNRLDWLRQKLAHAQEERDVWRQRVDTLEKSKRLNMMYNKDG